MAKKELKVYLDHHIHRDNLLYKRASSTTNGDNRFNMKHIFRLEIYLETDRKPDV